MRILQLGPFPFPSHQGSQVYVRGMAAALARRGHEVTLATYGRGAPGDLDGVRWLPAGRVPAGGFEGSGLHWSRPLHDARLAATIRRAGPFDMVHAHNVEGPWVARSAWPIRRPPLAYGVHTFMAEELHSYAPAPLAPLLRRAGRWVDASVLPLVDVGVAISERAAKTLRGRGLPTWCIPPGVTLHELEGADPSRARQRWALGDGVWVAYAGNLDGYQDLEDLLDAMTRVRGAGLLVLTGGDVDALHRKADQRRLPRERRRFIATRSFEDHRDGLAAARCAVIPRRVCAGFPIKMLNQLGLGVPTVATDGAPRLHGTATVPAGDLAAMAAAIQRWVDRPQEAVMAGRQGRRQVREEFSWAARAAALEELYDVLVELRRRGRSDPG